MTQRNWYQDLQYIEKLELALAKLQEQRNGWIRMACETNDDIHQNILQENAEIEAILKGKF